MIGIQKRLAPHPAPVFQNHVPADPVQKRAALFRIVPNRLPLLRAEEPHQRFLHQIVHIGAIVPHMIENFVAQLEAQAIGGWFVEIHFGSEPDSPLFRTLPASGPAF